MWYSGRLWRVVSINSDGSIKLVTQGNMTTIAWDTTDSIDYGTSQVHSWLNNEFLPTLSNANSLLVSSTWDYTNDIVTNEKVGLLNIDEFESTGGTSTANTTNTFLNNGYNWWTMSPKTDDSKIYAVSSNGITVSLNSSSSYGIRPSVSLISNVEIDGGTGIYSDPYRINKDKLTGQTGELLNNRVSGEYITFDDIKYRIVGTEFINNKKLTKVTMSDYDINNNTIDSEVQFGNNGIFSETAGIGAVLKEWYDNDINDTYKKMIATSDDGVVWYQGVDAGNDYTLAKTGTEIAATIGLPYYGEMFFSQLGSDEDSPGYFLSMTRHSTSSSYVWYVYPQGNANYISFPKPGTGARPSFYLKANVKIGDNDGDGSVGNGTLDKPYEITQ